MNLINQKVMHKQFGEGVIISLKDSGLDYTNDFKLLYLDIEFEKVGLKKFMYPTSFEGFLTFKNKELHKDVEVIVSQRNKEVAEKKERDELIRQYMAKAREEEKNKTKGSRGRKKKDEF